MNLRSLKYFVAIAEQRHFGKAAKSCFVSQPALSMQIKNFEEYLGVRLVERTNKSVLLTEIGEILLLQAIAIIDQIEFMHETIKYSKDPHSGDLKMGIIPTLAPYILPKLIPSLSKLFPKLNIYITEEPTACLIEKLKQGKLDTILLAPPFTSTNLITIDLFTEELVLVVPKNHFLSTRKKIIQQELKNTNLLLVGDADDGLRKLALTLCRMNKLQEVSGFRATSLQTLNHMVATGVGISIMPKFACKKNMNVSYIPFVDPKPTRRLGMIWRASTAKKHFLEDISKCIRGLLKNMARKSLAMKF